MTGMDVAGGALLAHAEGSRKQSDNFTGLATLLEQARVHDECFGPIGRFLADCYFDSLQECQDSSTKAASFLDQIADALKDTADAYGATDAANASGLTSAGEGVGSLGQLNHGADGERKSDFEQASVYGSSWADASAKLADAGTPAEAGFALFNARMEQLNLLTSPGQALFDNGLGWLISLAISPLVNFILEPAIGDPEQMRATAKGWEGVADWLNRVADHEKERADATASGWQGEAGDAFRGEMAEFADGARALSGDVSGLKGILETAADIFDTFVQVVVDIIQEFVIGLIIEWLAALAASWITAGASVVAAEGATVAQGAVTGGRLATRVRKLQGELYKLVKELERILVKVRQNPIVKQAIDRANGVAGTRGVGGFLGRKMDAASPVLGTVRNHTASNVVDGVEKGLLTKSGNRFFGKDAVGEEALAQRVTKVGLGYLGLGGSTNTGTVIIRGTLENVPGAAVEWGLKQGEAAANDPSTSEERDAAEDRGFTID